MSIGDAVTHRATRSDTKSVPYLYVGDRIKWNGVSYVKYGKLYAPFCSECGSICPPKAAGEINRSSTGMFFCSKVCSGLYRRTNPDRACKRCGRKFRGPTGKTRPNRGKFCSKCCYTSWQKTEDNGGANHPNYHGGYEGRDCKRQEYRKWRTAIFERDGYTCQNCGQYSGYLMAHHIKLVSKHPGLELTLSNGITLCRKCHWAIHAGRRRDEYPLTILQGIP